MNRIIDHITLAITIGIIYLFTVCLAGRLLADTTNQIQADYVEGEKSADLITPEVQAAAAAMMGPDNAQAFLHAMQLNMVKYDMDMQNPSGRRNWHGELVSEEFHTNELVKIEVYSNKVSGAVWRYKLPFKPKEIKATNRKVSYSTNGIPARLAAARALRASQINNGTVVTNIDTVANSPK